MIEIKTNKITGGGVSAALCVLMLFLSSVVPNLKMAFLFSASIIVAISLLRYKLVCALCCYLAASVLSVFILQDKFVALSFFAVFGNYPIIKLYIEKIRNIVLEYVLKFAAANFYLFFIYIILKALGERAFFDFNMVVLYIAGVVLLLLYDLLFSIVINAFYKSYYKYLK